MSPITCKLNPFPGGLLSTPAVGTDELDYSLPAPPSQAIVEAAWCVTLHLHTNLEQICFQSTTKGVGASTKFSAVNQEDNFETITTKLASGGQDKNNELHEYNTAVIFNGKSGKDQHENSRDDDFKRGY